MSGAPFLIARGRRRGYSTLLAPGWLLAANDHGFLEEAVGPVDEPLAWRSAAAVSPGGRRVALAWSEHAVTTADVGTDAGTGTGPAGDEVLRDGVLRDEHSRPLRLLYGFACADAVEVVQVAAADLDRSRVAAVGTYRRFLADEERFTVEASAPFELVSELAGVARVGALAPRPASASRPVPVAGPVPAARSVPVAGSPVGRGAARPRPAVPLAAWVAIATFAAALLVAVGIWLSAGSGDPPQPSCEPTPSNAASLSDPAPAPGSPQPAGKPTLPPCR